MMDRPSPSLFALLLGLSSSACQDSAKVSAAKAAEHVVELRADIDGDVREVRDGLPQGSQKLAEAWLRKEGFPDTDPIEMRRVLDRTRESVQLLRVAKSTFFAVANRDGIVLRNDHDQDLMAGKSLFQPFPALKDAAQGKYVETIGAMEGANGVAGKPDGQWIAAAPVHATAEIAGIYVTGWAWSSYAHRLEFALHSSIRSSIAKAQDHSSEPLTYVFLIVGQSVFCAPETPQVDADAVAQLKPLDRLSGAPSFTTELEVTERSFGFAAVKAPALGDNVAVGVLRSEI